MERPSREKADDKIKGIQPRRVAPAFVLLFALKGQPLVRPESGRPDDCRHHVFRITAGYKDAQAGYGALYDMAGAGKRVFPNRLRNVGL